MIQSAVNETGTERRLRLVQTHGYNGLALLTLYDGWRYFEPARIDGFIAYELHRSTAVACGDPVCAPADLEPLLRAFAEYCAAHRWRFTFVGASPRVGAAAHALGFDAVKVGEEAIFELATYGTGGRGAKKVRSATNLARRHGVTVEEYRRQSPAIDREIEAVAQEWLDTRDALPMSFLLRSRPFALREHKRIFIAWHEGRIVGAMTCAPAPARSMLYLEEQVRRVDAPYGTSELLIDEARRIALDEGIALFSLGPAPLQNATAQPFGRYRTLTALFRILCSKVNFVYSFRSLNHFKKKFAPTRWEDSFLVYNGSVALAALAIVTAFAPDGLPSLILPKRAQWLRLVPAFALWSCAAGGVLLAALAAWQLPELTLPFRLGFHGVAFAAQPADHALDRAAAHRAISAVVLATLAGAAFWQRRARA